MSKITNNGLIRSGTRCFIAVPTTHMTTVGVKGLNRAHALRDASKAHRKLMAITLKTTLFRSYFRRPHILK